MTKYLFLTLPFILFCFLTFDVSSVSYGARTTVSRGSTKQPQSSGTQSNTPQSSVGCDIKCTIPGQEAQRIGDTCGCYTSSDDDSLTGSMYNRNNDAAKGNNTTSGNASAAITACTTASEEAKIACDQDQDSGMQGAESALSKFAVQAGAMGLGACTQLAPLLAGANSATAYFSASCTSKRSDCMKTCTDTRAQITTIASDALKNTVESAYDECKKLESKIAMAQQSMQNVATSIQGAVSCAQSTDTAVFTYCQSNPTAVGCVTAATDCSNPQIAASNPICICKANPNSAQCTGAQAKADFGAADLSSAATAPKPTDSGINSDGLFNNLDYAGNGMTPSKGSAEDAGGKKGGSANLGDGGGGGAPGGEGGKGGGSPAAALAVNAGFRGGGGGGGWGGGGSGSGDGRAYAYSKGSQAGGPNGPNLRDFLPNGKLDPRVANRGLAGVSGPDGITGPHSDIWKKIQNRYRVQIESEKVLP